LASPNSGGTDGPFKTLGKAQAAMRASSTIKTATLRGTTWVQASEFNFNSTDNGESWLPYPQEKPVIDGSGSGFFSGNSSSFTIEGITLKNMAGGAALLWNDGGGLTARWNTFLNCTVRCLWGDNVSSALIDSNTFDGVGDGQNDDAIALTGSSNNNRVTHNLLVNAKSFGIGIGPGDNNIYDRNILRNICTAINDCGAIYDYDPAHAGTGNQITNNLIDGVGNYRTATTTFTDNATKAIYIDDGASNVLVKGNICRGCGAYALQFHGGDHNTVANNIFDLSSGGSVLGFYQTSVVSAGMTSNTFTNNIIYSGSSFHNPLWSLNIGSGDAMLADNTNLYYSATGAAIPNSGVVDTNPKHANPAFTNPGAGDYTIPSNSPAYTDINWQTLPVDQGPLASPF
jgi:Right handed beta helix region